MLTMGSSRESLMMLREVLHGHSWYSLKAYGRGYATPKTSGKKNCAPLETIKVGYPMEVFAVDILGPLQEGTAGKVYVSVAADYLTKWV